MEARSFSEADMRNATLAGKVLPLVQTKPHQAFPAAIAREMADRPGDYTLENEVGAALRYLEEEGLLVSEKVRHPEGHPVKVKLYTLTPKGAFQLSLMRGSVPAR